MAHLIDTPLGIDGQFTTADTRAATMTPVVAYREAMAGFARMGTMEVWYAHLDEDDIRTTVRAAVGAAEHHDKNTKGRHDRKDEKGRTSEKGKPGKPDRALQRAYENAEKTLAKAHSRDSLQALSKLAELVDVSTGSSTSPRSWFLCVTSPPPTESAVTRQTRSFVTSSAPTGHAAVRPATPVGAVRDRRRGAQSGRRRQRRHPGIHRPAAGTRRARPPVPAGQGGDGVGSGAGPAEEPLCAARRERVHELPEFLLGLVRVAGGESVMERSNSSPSPRYCAIATDLRSGRVLGPVSIRRAGRRAGARRGSSLRPPPNLSCREAGATSSGGRRQRPGSSRGRCRWRPA